MSQIASMTPRRAEAPARFEARQPLVPGDLDAQTSELLRRIGSVGLRLNVDAIIAKGKELFTRLVEVNKDFYLIYQRGGLTDFTRWADVESFLRAEGALRVPIPGKSAKDYVRGVGGEKDRYSRVTGFSDLWKVADGSFEVRELVRVHELFENLLYARSLLIRAENDGRARSSFFTSGLTGPFDDFVRARLFDNWRRIAFEPAEAGSSFLILRFCDLLPATMGWLSNDQTLKSEIERGFARFEREMAALLFARR